MSRFRSSKLAAAALAVTLLSVLVLFNLSQLIPPLKTHNLGNILPKKNSDSRGIDIEKIKNGTDNLIDNKLEEKLNSNKPPKSKSYSCGYKVYFIKYFYIL